MSGDVATGHAAAMAAQTVEWVRPEPVQVRARCETALWWLGLPAALWAGVALAWATWAWIAAATLAVWLLLILSSARAHVRAQRWACTPDAFLAESGVVLRTSSALPWSRVRAVELTEGPIDSRLGLAQLVVKVPGLGLSVGGLAADQARALRAEILTRAGRPVTAPDADVKAREAEVRAALGKDSPAEDGAEPTATVAAPDPTNGDAKAVPSDDAWFRAHPASVPASWLSAVLWLMAFGMYLVLRESDELSSVADIARRVASSGGTQIGATLLAAVAVLGAARSVVVRRRTAWAIDGGQLHERYEGRTRRHTTTPLERIERVDLSMGMGERLFGLASVKVMADGDGTTTIGSVPRARAQELRVRLLAAARTATAGEPVHEAAPAPATEPDPAIDHVATPEPLVVTDRRTVVRAFVLRDPLLPAAVAGAVGTVVTLLVGVTEPLFVSLGAIAFAGRRAWRAFDSSLGRTVTEAPEGLVVTSGLGTLATRTVRRGRTHAVRLSRRATWWGADLWTVTALGAASEAADETGEDEDEVSGALLTAGESAAALAVSQAALPDLACVDRRLLRDVWPAPDGVVVPDPEVDGAPVGLLRVPSRAWWLYPLTWRVRVAAVVADGLLVRTGRLAPRVTFVPLRHVQGVGLDEGPLLRRAGVVSVDVHLVKGPVRVAAGPFEPDAAQHLVEVLARAAAQGRRLDLGHDGGRMGA